MKVEISKPVINGGYTIIIVDDRGNKQYCKLPKRARGIQDAVLHREDGPALDYVNTYKGWYKDGKMHRDDGPAVEFNGQACSYWKNGVKIEPI